MVVDGSATTFSQHNRLSFRRSAFQILTKRLKIFSEGENLAFDAKWAPHRLDADMHVHTDDQGLNEVLTIKTGGGWDYSFEVVDPRSDRQIGSLVRRDFKSFIADEWKIMSDSGERLGTLRETSLRSALFSRSLGWIYPQSYEIVDVDDQVAATFNRRVNPFFMNGDMTLSPQTSLDNRFVLAACILLSFVEARQGS